MFSRQPAEVSGFVNLNFENDNKKLTFLQVIKKNPELNNKFLLPCQLFAGAESFWFSETGRPRKRRVTFASCPKFAHTRKVLLDTGIGNLNHFR